MPDAPEPQPDSRPDDSGGPARHHDQSSRRRLLDALRKPARTQVVAGVLLALLGFAVVTQIRSNDIDNSYASLREQDLIDLSTGLAGTTQRAQAEIDRLLRTRTELQSDSSRRQAALEQAQEEADSLNVLAGLVPVTGPGIRATVTEDTGTVSISSMLDLIEQLRSNGAEAIQFNGQVRVVAQTSVAAGVGGLVVDGTQLEAPYVIDAIGVANTLAQSVEFPLGPRAQLRDDGASIDVQELTSLDIETVREPVQPDFAEPDPGQ